MPIRTLSEQVAGFVRHSHGDSVRDKRLGQPGYDAPEDICLLYIRVDHDSGLHVRHYQDQLNGRTVDQAEADLLAEARPSGDRAKPHLKGQNFEGMVFDRPSWFTILLDEAEWSFFSDPAVPGNDPIVFLAQKDGDATGKQFDPNHSFYDAELVRVDGRPAVRCINFCKTDAAGTPLPTGATTNFCYEINLRAPFALPGSESHITIIIDPTGENRGPKP
jgi:hypothetical protein